MRLPVLDEPLELTERPERCRGARSGQRPTSGTQALAASCASIRGLAPAELINSSPNACDAREDVLGGRLGRRSDARATSDAHATSYASRDGGTKGEQLNSAEIRRRHVTVQARKLCVLMPQRARAVCEVGRRIDKGGIQLLDNRLELAAQIGMKGHARVHDRRLASLAANCHLL